MYITFTVSVSDDIYAYLGTSGRAETNISVRDEAFYYLNYGNVLQELAKSAYAEYMEIKNKKENGVDDE
jgi:hypothetical protein